jgi:hypothetical protein
MKNTKREFLSAAKKRQGFKTWFIEQEAYSRDYVIEISVDNGYTIGDNQCTSERVHVLSEELTISDGWRLAIKALQTIKQK